MINQNELLFVLTYILKIVMGLDESRIPLKDLIIYLMHLKRLIEVFMIHKQGIPKRLFLNVKTSEDIVRHLVQQGLTKRITIVYQKHINCSICI